MIMTGHYRFALHPGADAGAFEEHLIANVFTSPRAVQATRITSGVDNQLLRATPRLTTAETPEPSSGPQYVWAMTINLVTDAGYDYDRNAAAMQELVADHATLIGVEAFVSVPPPAEEDSGDGG